MNARRVLAMAAAPLVLLIPTACSGDEPPPPIQIAAAPTTSTAAKLNLRLPQDGGGAVAYDKWPKACELITDADLAAVLPQAKATRKPRDAKLRVIGDLVTRDVTVPGAECTMELAFPGQADNGGFFNVVVSVGAVGTPAYVARNFSADADPVAFAANGGRCYADKVGVVSCTKGPMYFSVATSSSWQQTGKPPMRSRYVVAGTQQEFTGKSGDVAANQKRLDFEMKNITYPFARMILSRY